MRAVAARRGPAPRAVALCALAALGAFGLAAYAPVAIAAPEEIQVYMDDMSAPGQFGLDVHNNYVPSGRSEPSYAGEEPPAHVYRLTPEFYYGLRDTVELGAYLLTTHDAAGRTYFDGEKLRVKFIAPHDGTRGTFWGANLEVGRTDRRVSESPWNAELKGIWGYRTGAWTLAANANADWSPSPHGGPTTFEADGKVAYAVLADLQLGVETYDELGPVSGPLALGAQSQVSYLALDTTLGRFDLNAGVGHGWTGASDRWVFKFIIGTHFGKP
jgi:hypothetical protein